MNTILTAFQLIIAVLLIATILIQAKGTGLGSAWGGGSEFYRSKRGVEKFLFAATITLGSLFVLSGIANLIIG